MTDVIMQSPGAAPTPHRHSASAVDTTARRPNFVRAAIVLLRLTWARTTSPMLLAGIVALVLLPMLFALAFASRGPMSGDATPFLISRFDSLVCGLATPLIALLLGTSAFSAETEDGTLLYLVTTTMPRWWIVLVRLVFAGVLTGALSALSIAGTGYLAQGSYDPYRVTYAFTIAGAFGGFVYAGLFSAFALYTKRALVFGLGYVIFWEGVLSATFPGANYLSVRQWMLGVASSLTEASDARLASGPGEVTSLVSAGVMLVGALVLASRKLSRPRVGRT